MTTATASFKTVQGEKTAVPNSAGTEPPKTAIPEGATDCHLHIFDERFPSASGKPVSEVGTVGHYRLMMQRLGLSRAVIVAPGTYSNSNDCLLDALDDFGDITRGVAIVPPDVSDQELKALHRRGVRGARFYFREDRLQPREETETLAKRLAGLGWHMEFVVSQGDKLVENEKFLAALACRVVIDHFGYVPQPEGVRHPSAASLRRLLEKGNTWLKLSGNYYTSKVGFPTYSDIDELAQFFVRNRPDRMLWGTDWPHTHKVHPDAAMLLDQLAVWAPIDETRKRILVDNPQQLYWYA